MMSQFLNVPTKRSLARLSVQPGKRLSISTTADLFDQRNSPIAYIIPYVYCSVVFSYIYIMTFETTYWLSEVIRPILHTCKPLSITACGCVFKLWPTAQFPEPDEVLSEVIIFLSVSVPQTLGVSFFWLCGYLAVTSTSIADVPAVPKLFPLDQTYWIYEQIRNAGSDSETYKILYQ